MDERRISKVEFDAAVEQVQKNMIEEPKLEGMSKLMVPLIGTMFADNIAKILFPKEETKEAAE